MQCLAGYVGRIYCVRSNVPLSLITHATAATLTVRLITETLG
jgi:hypothetical protein